MSKFQVRFKVPVEVVVTLDASDDDDAADRAWVLADEYANTVLGDHQSVRVDISMDGIGADEVIDLCHNGHPFEPGISEDDPDQPDPLWCNTCGEARRESAAEVSS